MIFVHLTKSYWKIPLAKADKEKTAFSTPEGLYQHTVPPFGLHGAPATFQQLMDKLLHPHGKYAAANLGDIIIHSPDWETHLEKVEAVLDTMKKAELTANPSKCVVGLAEAKYLRYIVGRGVVKPQLNKLEAIQNWPRPVWKKQVRTFLGLVGYYRRFIPPLCHQGIPINRLNKSLWPRHNKMDQCS
ncbi:unnamed protein product [Lepidochelys kempii]